MRNYLYLLHALRIMFVWFNKEIGDSYPFPLLWLFTVNFRIDRHLIDINMLQSTTKLLLHYFILILNTLILIKKLFEASIPSTCSKYPINPCRICTLVFQRFAWKWPFVWIHLQTEGLFYRGSSRSTVLSTSSSYGKFDERNPPLRRPFVSDCLPQCIVERTTSSLGQRAALLALYDPAVNTELISTRQRIQTQW